MIEPKLEVPAELRDLAEKTIDQAEKAFGMFFDAAGKSIASVPNPGAESIYQCRRAYETDHWRRHVCGERRLERQDLARERTVRMQSRRFNRARH
jgi:hypothetical protein